MPGGDRLTLAGMTFSGRHGALPEEREATQPFVVSVDLFVDAAAAAAADALAAAVDYPAVFGRVRRVVETTSHRLIETLAEAIATDVLESFDVDEVEVRLRKPQAPLPGRFDHVEITVRRVRRDERGPARREERPQG